MRIGDEAGIPYVITEHMGPFPLPVYEARDGSILPFIRQPLERAGARIAVSPSLARRIGGFGIPEPEWVPNLIDERLYGGESHAPRDRFVFFTLGGMLPVKGYPDLLQAIALFLERLPEQDHSRVEFRLAGYGPCLEAYRAECRRLGLDAWVSWPGFLSREQARHEFHNCDCYVLASHHESFGVVLVEAMASGRPVIATRCGGPEAIVTPDNGILVDVGRPPQLAEAMMTMYSSARRFDPQALREAAFRTFSRPVVVDQLERIYRCVLEADAGVGARASIGERAER
jgi:glycosyltransferase involved in cell wall biosynthesis